MSILKKPIITEKMTAQADKARRYGFVVDKNANKIQIKKAVQDMYGVQVDEVRTMNYYGKTKTRYTKAGFQTGTRSVVKKAIITLKEGENIDFYNSI